MEKKKKLEIRFLIDEKSYSVLKEEAERLNIPLSNLAKIKILGIKK